MTSRAKMVLAACVATWAVAAVWGGYRFAAAMPNKLQQARIDETSRRETSWSPISGFAQACVAGVPRGAQVWLIDITDRPLVTLPAARTGPAAFGAPNDVDWPNQSVFSYTFYPRSIVPFGHIPTSVHDALETTPYVALWDQAGYRSSAAHADSTLARQQLMSSSRAQVVCTYSDRFGNQGWILATNGSAEPAGAGSQPQSLTIAGLALTVLGLGVLWTIGGLILGTLGVSKSWPGLWAAAAFPMGCGAVAVQMLITSATGRSWSLLGLLAPWIVFFGLIAWRRPTWLRHLLAWRFKLSGLDRYEVAAIAGLVALLAIVAVASPLALPQSDGFSLYYFKANAFFTDGSVSPYYQHASDLLFSFPAHPPLIPLSVTWLYLFIGHVEERSTLLLWPALFASLLGVFYVLTRTRANRREALWYVLIVGFVASGLLGEATGSGYTDMPLALFLLLGAGCLWLWAGVSHVAWVLPVAGGVFLGAAILTKEEGLLGAIAVITASLLLTWARRKSMRGVLGPGFATGVVAAAVAAIWFAFRLSYRLPVLTVDLEAKLESASHRLLPAIIGLGLRAAPEVMLAAIVIVGVIVVYRAPSERQIFDRRFQFLATAVLTVLAGDVLAFAIAPVEIGYQIQVAGARLVSQVLPLLLLALVQPWRLLVAAATSRPKEEKNDGEHLYANSRRARTSSPDRPVIRAGRSST